MVVCRLLWQSVQVVFLAGSLVDVLQKAMQVHAIFPVAVVLALAVIERVLLRFDN